jgi:hemerythrin
MENDFQSASDGRGIDIMISWNEDFRLGVKEIDEQHRQLFDIAGRAYELLRNDMHFRV